MGTWTTDPYHDAAWEGYMQMERTQLTQRASGQMRRAIGRVLKGESEEDLERIAAEDQRRAKEVMVPLRKDGRVYYKHISDLTREDVAARLEAERFTVMWLKGRIERVRGSRLSCARTPGTTSTPTLPRTPLLAGRVDKRPLNAGLAGPRR
jgi:hypothetical protein